MKTLLPFAILTAILSGCTGVQKHTSPQFASSYSEPIYEESDVTISPRFINRPIFDGPATLTGKAETVLSLIITPEGTVVVEDVISQTEGPFTIAAIKSIKGAKFYPGQINGHPVATRIALPLSHDKNHPGSFKDLNIYVSPQTELVSTPSLDISGK